MKKLCLGLMTGLLLAGPLNAQQSFSFIHLSDLHVATQPSEVNLCDLNGVEAQCYLQYYTNMQPKPAFVLCSGDISNIGNCSCASDGMYSALRQFLYPANITYPGVGSLFIDSAQTIPIYFAPGNHDYYTTLLPPGTLTQLDSLPTYAKYIAPDSDYAVTTPVSVILYVRSGSDISYLISTDPKGSGLTDAQMSWMRTTLSQNRNKRKIIVMHHPAANFEGTGCNLATHNAIANDSSASFYVNRLAFLEMCDSNQVDVVLAGHSHQNVVVDRYGNQIDENCDTCGTRYVQTGPAFAGCYRLVTVDTSFVTVSVVKQSCPALTAVNNLAVNDVDISAYPNPSDGRFKVSLGQTVNATLKLFDLFGNCVFTSQGTAADFDVALNNPTSGIYFLTVDINDSVTAPLTFRYPLIIQR